MAVVADIDCPSLSDVQLPRIRIRKDGIKLNRSACHFWKWDTTIRRFAELKRWWLRPPLHGRGSWWCLRCSRIWNRNGQRSVCLDLDAVGTSVANVRCIRLHRKWWAGPRVGLMLGTHRRWCRILGHIRGEGVSHVYLRRKSSQARDEAMTGGRACSDGFLVRDSHCSLVVDVGEDWRRWGKGRKGLCW